MHRPLIKAHAIPQVFFDIQPQQGANTPRLMTNKEGEYPRRAPIGVYDTGILCQECEDSFSDVDGYAAQLLLQQETSFRPLKADGKIEGYEVWDYNYDRLKLFFMSVLWRASASSHLFYAQVDVGPYEPILREMLIKKDAGEPDNFSVVLWKYDDHPSSTVIFDPFRARYEGINCFRFRLHRYVSWVKVDKRPFPSGIREVQLSKRPPMLVMHSPFAESQDHRLAKALVRGEHAERGPGRL